MKKILQFTNGAKLRFKQHLKQFQSVSIVSFNNTAFQECVCLCRPGFANIEGTKCPHKGDYALCGPTSSNLPVHTKATYLMFNKQLCGGGFWTNEILRWAGLNSTIIQNQPFSCLGHV